MYAMLTWHVQLAAQSDEMQDYLHQRFGCHVQMGTLE